MLFALSWQWLTKAIDRNVNFCVNEFISRKAS